MTEAHIKNLYHTYICTSDLTYAGLFYSPACMQICEPIPSFCATSREQIVQHRKDAEAGTLSFDKSDATKNAPAPQVAEQSQKPKPKYKLWYSIYSIHVSSASFGTQESCAAIDMTPEELRRQAKAEGWVGMRVDLWDESEQGLLVKVQYWWRKEEIGNGEDLDGDEGGRGWRQCLHDIMYLGPKDGSEGVEGEVRERG